MRVLKFLKSAICVISLGLSLCVLSTRASDAKDNVVIIHVDDLGWRDLGVMGSPVYETPHIDKLAESGTLFTSAYAAASLCTPSRACMLTGSQPTRHGMYTVVKNRGKKEHWRVLPTKNRQYMQKDYPTIGTLLTEAGVANGAIGKWHVAVKTPSNGFAEGKWGGYLGLPINYFSPFKLGFLPKDVPDGAYLPEYIREAGIDFLERHKAHRFFLYFSTYLPHDEIKNEGEDSTLSAPDSVVEKYKKKITAMTNAGQDLQGHTNPIYAAMIEETDRSVGAVVDKLDELGIREKTLVLFISDNGGHQKYTSNAPLRGFKSHHYEGGIRVPMIASMPGKIAAGKVSDEPVSGLDYYPTICSYLGLTPSDKNKVDGEDLSPVLFEGKSLGERNLFWYFPCYTGAGGLYSRPRMVMRRGDWKLHYDFETKGYELYNLANDIGETRNLAHEAENIFIFMKKEMKASCERFGAPQFLESNPEYDKALSKAEADKLPKIPLMPDVSTSEAYTSMGITLDR